LLTSLRNKYVKGNSIMSVILSRLDDVCEIIMGQAPSGAAYNKSGNGWMLIAGAGDFGEIYPAPKKFTTEASKLSNPGDIILGIRATIGEKVLSNGEYCLGRGVAALRSRTGLNSRYLWHWLEHIRPELCSKSKGATFKQVNRQDIAELKISLLPIDQQKRIAAILDKAEELRSLRRQSIKQLDILGRSIFIEMFGDPIFNQHKWQRTQLVNLCISPDNIKCGSFGTQLSKDEYKTEGVPLWGIRNVNALFKIPTKEFLELKTANKLIQYSIQSGDIVMTRKGTVGNCAVYPEGYPLGIMHSDLLRLRINYQVCNPIFLSHQLHYSRDVAQQIELISGGAIMPGINVTNLKSLEVLTPPHPLQQEFAQRIEAIEHQKSQHRESLAQLDKLFASLQHRAFRGEL
jgi:type I restriction enzyme, S subunit